MSTTTQKKSEILPSKRPAGNVYAQINCKSKRSSVAGDFTYTRITLLDTIGDEVFKCENCGKQQYYTKPIFGNIEKIACSSKCAKEMGFFGKLDLSRYSCSSDKSSKTKTRKTAGGTCSKCGGKKRGRGYSHTEDCTENSINKKISENKPLFCPKCNGKRRGRGYSHTSDCESRCAVKK